MARTRSLSKLLQGAAGIGLVGLMLSAAPAAAAVSAAQMAQPVLTTTANPAVATVGAILKDTATLSGGNNPTIYISFQLFDPTGNYMGVKVGVRGNGTYVATAPGPANMAGTWYWRVVYMGDQNNHSAVAPDELVVVMPAPVFPSQPTIATVASPAQAEVGEKLQAGATLAGGNNPGASIRFTLYEPGGQVSYSEQVTVHGNGTYATATGHVAEAPGTWQWKAEYLGDARNKPATSGMQPVVVTKAGPVIIRAAYPRTATVGTTLVDAVYLAGGSNPSGNIVFILYDPYGNAVHSEQVSVAGNGRYSTPSGYVATKPGTWAWTAAYGGDQNNLPASTDSAPVSVSASAAIVSTGWNGTAQLALLVGALLAAGLVVPLAVYLWRRHR